MDLDEYANEYLKFMNTVHKNGHSLNVSTITLICDLNVETICIQTFCENFEEPNITMKVCKPNTEVEVTKRGRVKKSFYNQVTLNYKDISKKSIKIFSNGKLQITGLTSYYECEVLTNYVISILRRTLTNEDISVTRRYVGMINSNFSVKTNLDLQKLNKILNKKVNVMSIYNPESYPAINMKYTQSNGTTISIFIFGTGNIVITGGKTLAHMRASYDFIYEEILRNHSNVCKKTTYIPKENKVESYIEGYPIRQYMSCVTKKNL